MRTSPLYLLAIISFLFGLAIVTLLVGEKKHAQELATQREARVFRERLYVAGEVLKYDATSSAVVIQARDWGGSPRTYSFRIPSGAKIYRKTFIYEKDVVTGIERQLVAPKDIP